MMHNVNQKSIEAWYKSAAFPGNLVEPEGDKIGTAEI
jgi:hypothetical protein